MLQGFLKDLGNSEGLADQRAQFFKHRTFQVRLVIDLAAFDCTRQNVGLRKAFELALHSPRPQTDAIDDFFLQESTVRRTEKKPEHGLPGLAV